jgi:uncharacterized protein YndB with AHSA1/START domain
MITNEVSIFINRPIEQVFAFISDSQNRSKWQANLVKSEKITDGSVRLGTQLREFRRMGRREVETQVEVTAFEFNRHFSTKTITKPLVTDNYSFESENGGTRVQHQYTMTTSGIMRLFEPLIARPIKNGLNESFGKLKRLLES